MKFGLILAYMYFLLAWEVICEKFYFEIEGFNPYILTETLLVSWHLLSANSGEFGGFGARAQLEQVPRN